MAMPSAEDLNTLLRGYDQLYGIKFVEVSDTDVHARVLLRDELRQPFGHLHGGVYASLAESMCSLATALAVLDGGMTALGLSNNTSFLRPINEGSVHAQATRLHRGRTTWVWDVRFSDDDGRLCAVTRMTLAIRPVPGDIPDLSAVAGEG